MYFIWSQSAIRKTKFKMDLGIKSETVNSRKLVHIC